jgi:hypothetical protein
MIQSIAKRIDQDLEEHAYHTLKTPKDQCANRENREDCEEPEEQCE